MAQTIKVQCCIAGGGPAGMMLGYLLGRAGVSCVVLEKHSDFLRDFRGDTVHPSTLQIMHELDLLQELLELPHSKIHALSVDIGRRSFTIAEFARVPTHCRFIALMPQWDFLNLLARKSQRFASLRIIMSAQVTNLIEAAGRVIGVNANTPDGLLEVRADLVVGCDGRGSTVRAGTDLPLRDLGSPIDVLWFRLSKKAGDPEQVLGHLGQNTMIVTINRSDYWQCAYVIAKGGIERVRAGGLEAFRRAVADGAPFLSDRMDELKSFDELKLLSVSINRLSTWSRPGVLCIGDAAHAMSPIGGVGINLAIQDAVATANLLAAKLREGSLRDSDLDSVQRRRLFPVKLIQRGQLAIQNRLLQPIVSGQARPLKVPWVVKLLDRNAWLRRWPAQIIGVGVRPEHVHSDAHIND